MNSKDPAGVISTSVQKSYFMLSHSAREVLDAALQKYRPGTNLIPVGGIAQLKAALRLMMYYRLTIREVNGAEVVGIRPSGSGAGKLKLLRSPPNRSGKLKPDIRTRPIIYRPIFVH